MRYWVKKGAEYISALTLFIRFSTLSFSLLLPLLGVATGRIQPIDAQIVGLVGIAIMFHCFAYVFNDIVDLPLDRTQDLRSQYPLVKGDIQPGQALMVVLAQIPLSLALSFWMKASYTADIVLGIAFVCMTIYDLWGKRTLFPLLTDCIQGVGWGALMLYGAMLHSDHLNVLAGMLFFFIVVYILIVNGIHGGLRDLANDLKQGVCTTAILLGAKSLPNGSIKLSLRVYLYTTFLQVLLSGIILTPLVYNWFGYESLTWRFIGTIVSVFLLISSGLLCLAATLTEDRSRLVSIGTLQIVIALSCLVLLFIPYLNTSLLIAVLATYTLPLCSLSPVRKQLHKQMEKWISIGSNG